MHQAHDRLDTMPAGMRLPAPMAPERAGLPLFLSAVQAGFPSPADDSVEDKLDLHRHLVRNETAIFYLHASGDSTAARHRRQLRSAPLRALPRAGKCLLTAWLSSTSPRSSTRVCCAPRPSGRMS
ncbi:MAG: hypothetical protein II132_01895 [Desulfovibrio sp.]|nr:hypothetical protein [Desulfovibrio sp.]MBQ4125898.1 hypothetical protein [Desulfovibrio sp.]